MKHRLYLLIMALTAVLTVAGCKPNSTDQVAGVHQTNASKALDLRAKVTQIRIEPKYSATPYYALLVFGEKADIQTWLVVDSTTVYLDRNGDGDLTAPDEKIALDKNIKGGGDQEFNGMNVFDLGSIAATNLYCMFGCSMKTFAPKKMRMKSSLVIVKND